MARHVATQVAREFKEPIIIVGAPRSGTTFIHHALREQDGMASLPMESEYIWSRFTHPALNNWQGEGWPGDTLAPSERKWISRQFRHHAFSSAFWRAANPRVRNYRRSNFSAGILRSLFHGAMTLRAVAAPLPGGLRLVEKSVNSALFLPLLLEAFPTARFVFISRHPAAAIPSICTGWLNPNRFETFSVPESLSIPDYSGTRWNFPLPAGWQSFVDRPLAEVAAFQWQELNRRAIKFGSEHPDIWLHVRLEDLVQEPGAASARLAAFLDVNPSALRNSLARHGVVNATAGKDSDRVVPVNTVQLDAAIASVAGTAEQLGYRSG